MSLYFFSLQCGIVHHDLIPVTSALLTHLRSDADVHNAELSSYICLQISSIGGPQTSPLGYLQSLELARKANPLNDKAIKGVKTNIQTNC